MNSLLAITLLLFAVFICWVVIKYLQSDSRLLFVASQKKDWFAYKTRDDEIVFTWKGILFTARHAPPQIRENTVTSYYFITPFNYEEIAGFEDSDVRLMHELLEETYPNSQFSWAAPLGLLIS
ncbi:MULTISPECIES: hypothetical protein [Brochothrix]|uniref:Sigma-w pathway protein ysdB n=1 Tax=Brochothrix thermosphacta TaxID=2756 RepID=A0A1D2L831_BROTH|nr:MULTISPECIES: hypothetical protein [Brochothrix]SLM93277.1 hypothetical protein FM106_06200 [Brachybacterium faecium]ANZ95731.1 hypothetical protein BFC19_10240 [Brochothrix thermosphacta]ANZ98217.1 hypothetical protein BFC20_11155 [Brochothrix thermosphacta]ATF25417.1 hypothetical protein CNY62_02850 [Brochothrix thermosphacta]ATH84748.1 hypothetical protein CPF12_02390 [Brochothrix thermosphacta]